MKKGPILKKGKILKKVPILNNGNLSVKEIVANFIE
jgi:hypothetical protein